MLFEEIINDVHKVVVMGCYVTRTVIPCLASAPIINRQSAPRSNSSGYTYQSYYILLFTAYKMSAQDPGFLAALSEAKKGASEGGVPIGACLVDKDGKILGQGHNLRVQNGSATLHVRSSISRTFDQSGETLFVPPFRL